MSKDLKEYVTASLMLTRDVEFEVTIEGLVHYEVDSAYGADADGNRGTSMTYVTEVTDIVAGDEDNKEYELNDGEIIEATGMLSNKFMEG